MTPFTALFTDHLGLSLARQLAFWEFLGEHEWSLDLERGTADFGAGRVYPVQLLGNEVETGEGAWVWAWAHRELPDVVLTAAHRLRDYGENKGIAELTEPELPLTDLDGHSLATVASGLCRADAYYRGPYDGGAVFFLVHDTPLQGQPISAERIANVIMTALAEYSVDHKRLTASLLRQEGFSFTREEGGGIATAPDGRALRVEFDADGELHRVEAVDANELAKAELIADLPDVVEEEPAPPVSGRPWWRRQ